MNKTLMDHVTNYEKIYKYVSDQSRSEEELIEYMLKEQGKAEFIIRAFIRTNKNGGAGLFAFEDNMITINKVNAQIAVDQFMKEKTRRKNTWKKKTIYWLYDEVFNHCFSSE